MKTKLYRSRTNRIIGGVCGGLGHYLGLDPTFVRLFFVLLALADGVGVLVYFLLWLIMPREGRLEEAITEKTIPVDAKEMAERARAMGDDLREAVRAPHPQAGVIIGVALIALGVVHLLRNLNIPWLWWLDFDLFWPLFLVAAGVFLLLRYVRGG